MSAVSELRSKRSSLLRTAAAFGFAFCFVATGRADVSLSVSVSRNQLYVGEAAIMTVKAAGEDDARHVPDVSAITDATVESLGSHSISRRSVRIVNGRMTQETFKGREFSFRVTPKTTGEFRAGPVRLQTDAGVVTANGPRITVTGVEEQDWVDVVVTASRESVLIDEAFTVTFAVRLRQLPGRFSDSTPLNPSEPPVLTVPYVEEEFEGLTGGDAMATLKSMLVRGPRQAGFAINDMAMRRDPFGDFLNFGMDAFQRRSRARFALPRRRVDVDGRSYWAYTLTLEYEPRDEGEYTFGPVLFKGPVVTAVNRQGRANARRVFAVGPAATVRVVPPPEKGRPESYVGVLGSNLTASASLDAQTCNVGDPLQLSVRIRGNVNLGKLRPPALWEHDALLRDFRLYQDTLQTDREDGAVTYRLTVRPQTAGTIEVPPIPVSYYNVNQRRYETVKTAPLPVRVNAVDVLRPDYVINAASNAVADGVESGTREEAGPLAPLDISPDGHVPVSMLGGRLTGMLAAVGPGVWILTVAGIGILRLIQSRRRGAGPRQARRRAIDALDKLVADPVSSQELHRRLAAVLRRYVAERLSDSRPGMTPDECLDVLDASGLPAATVDAMSSAIDEHFNAAFVSGGAVAGDKDTMVRVARSVIDRVEHDVRTATHSGGKA